MKLPITVYVPPFHNKKRVFCINFLHHFFVARLLKLEDGQVRLQSRLEEEEEAKAALMGRIQRLTKLILVSTKASPSSRVSHWPAVRRRHSFGEEEV